MGRKELAWLSRHQDEIDKYSGMWIAIWEGKVIGVGKTAKEVLRMTREKGINAPHLTIVPRRDEGTYVL